MKEQMILTAIVKGPQLEVRFHPDAPVEPAKLVALAKQNGRAMKLTPSYQVIARIEPGEYQRVFAQVDGILQALATCEKLEHSMSNVTGPIVN
jgi:hypothetical protein